MRTLAGDPTVGPDGVWALGLCGDSKSVDALIQAMSNPEMAKIAGEGFTTITGVPCLMRCASLASALNQSTNNVLLYSTISSNELVR